MTRMRSVLASLALMSTLTGMSLKPGAPENAPARTGAPHAEHDAEAARRIEAAIRAARETRCEERRDKTDDARVDNDECDETNER